METKKCSKCGEIKAVEEFYRKGKNYQSMCILCRVEYHKEWYGKNYEKRREQIKEYKQINRRNIKRKRDELKAKQKKRLKTLKKQ